MIDFWTYSCINCLRSLPYVKAWYENYRDHGLVVIGVHAPEFAFEKDLEQRAARGRGARRPLSGRARQRLRDLARVPQRVLARALFRRRERRIRGHHFGEGRLRESEARDPRLLAEAGQAALPPPAAQVAGEGVQRAADKPRVASPETYLGYARAERFLSPGGFARDEARTYAIPEALALNEWALGGRFAVQGERAIVREAGAPHRVPLSSARDLHLVLGPAPDGRPIRFRVTLDGRSPGGDGGMDLDASGEGVVREQRLYQLIRQGGPVTDRTFTIEFLDAGAQAYAFTFG